MSPTWISCPPTAGWHEFVIISAVQVRCQHDLFVVVEVRGLLGPVLGSAQRRKQHGRENGDDGDNYQ